MWRKNLFIPGVRIIIHKSVIGSFLLPLGLSITLLSRFISLTRYTLLHTFFFSPIPAETYLQLPVISSSSITLALQHES
jgi:hypothetical protein